MLVLIDNYDSFTYNLVQYFGDLGQQTTVYRNDEISAEDILKLKPQKLIISPGPKAPIDAGISMDIIKLADQENIPLLGVCLGHQAIGEVYGGKIIRAPRPVHGETIALKHNNTGLFKGLGNPATFTRYHSLIIEKDSCPGVLEITAESEDGLIMAVQHKEKPIYGVQFHPESIASTQGKMLLKNFLKV